MQKEPLSRPSKKQRELLDYIKGFIAQHGYGPSYREIMRALDYKSVSTVAVHVDGLVAKGLLRKHDRSARSIEVVSQADVTPHATAKVSVAEEKWLVDLVEARFADYEKAPTSKALDELFVLVGALSVLGIQDAAASFKPRLTRS